MRTGHGARRDLGPVSGRLRFPGVCERRRLADVIVSGGSVLGGLAPECRAESLTAEYLFLFVRRARGLGDKWLWVQILTLALCRLWDLRHGSRLGLSEQLHRLHGRPDRHFQSRRVKQDDACAELSMESGTHTIFLFFPQKYGLAHLR